MIWGLGKAGRAALLASTSLLAMAATATADYPAPTGHQAIGYGPEGLAGLGYGRGSWYAMPYHTKVNLYGYPDFAYGRGPLINLGGASMQPGFRGYGVVGSPGYGLGMYPSTWNDQRPRHGHGLGHGHGKVTDFGARRGW